MSFMRKQLPSITPVLQGRICLMVLLVQIQRTVSLCVLSLKRPGRHILRITCSFAPMQENLKDLSLTSQLLMPPIFRMMTMKSMV